MFNPDSGRVARVHFMSGSFRLLSPGDFVVCAVTTTRIPLAQLRYWNHELQEAYASPEAASQRLLTLKSQGRA
jgi:hypothetical protein